MALQQEGDNPDLFGTGNKAAHRQLPRMSIGWFSLSRLLRAACRFHPVVFACCLITLLTPVDSSVLMQFVASPHASSPDDDDEMLDLTSAVASSRVVKRSARRSGPAGALHPFTSSCPVTTTGLPARGAPRPAGEPDGRRAIDIPLRC